MKRNDKTMIELIIFDLDGTLVNSIYDLADAVNDSLIELGYPAHEVDKYYHFVGDGTLKLSERALPKNHRNQEEILQLHSMFSERYQKCCLNKTKAYEGINEVLHNLKESGIKCAVASNKPDNFAKYIVSQLFGNNIFDCVVGKKDSVPAKPAPDIIYDILGILNEDKNKTLLVGDSDVDVKTAHNSGIKCIGCVWGFRGETELKNAGSDFLAYKPSDINKIVNCIL